MSKRQKTWIAFIAVLLLLLTGYVSKWFIDRQARLSHADPLALAALTSSAEVLVREAEWITFEPTGMEASTGLIFYPGGECDERGYAELLHQIAAKGYFVVLVPMPLQLAVLAPNKASNVIAAYPQIEHWAISGHSLGGAMAARFVYKNPGKVDGLLFWDAYPPETDDISERTLRVGLIHRADEMLQPPDYYAKYSPLLPPHIRYWPLPGGNHINFGRFLPAERFRADAASATLQIEEQHRLIVAYTEEFLRTIP